MNKQIKTIEELKVILTENNINYNEFPHKTVDDLWEDYISGDCNLIVTPENKIARYQRVSYVRVYTPNYYARLIERIQVFKNGKTRVRWETMPGSLGEKIKIGECPQQGAQRALLEELELDVKANRLKPIKLKWSTRAGGPNTSYPGLKTRFEEWIFEIQLRESEVKEEYVEVQTKKSTYFSWMRLKT